MNEPPKNTPSSATGDLVVIQRNPTSGAGNRRQALLELVRELRHRQLCVRMFSSCDHLDEFINSGRLRCIVAAGGDGTIASLFNPHPNRVIGLLPMDNGYREFGRTSSEYAM